MSKAVMVYWSGTGNTEAMANAVARGAGEAAVLKKVSEITADEAAAYDILALGCPACGSEELEESEFEPFFAALESKLSGKKVGLFGSYNWGDGDWMRSWTDRVRNAGAEVIGGEGVTANSEPDAEALSKCEELGKNIAAL